MRILVTGGAGFIGSRLCRFLIEKGHTVTAYDNLMLGREEFLSDLRSRQGFHFVRHDLLNDPGLKNLVKGHDFVFHLAANSDISEGTKSTDLDLKYGVLATYNLLEAMRQAGVKEMVFSSTSAIYGEAGIKPTPENYGTLVPISLYGASKLACEAMVSAFCGSFGIQSWIFRFANVVGPNLTHGAIHDFVARLRKQPEILKVLGNGTQKKSYLHVDDCVEGMWYAINASKEKVNIFNLASEGVTEVKFIAENLVKQMGLGSKIEYGSEDRGWVGDVPFTWLDASLLTKLGWKARLTSAQAVTRAIGEALEGSVSR